jgi:hypothetical protein
MDFSITNADDLLWVAPDGTTSTAVKPQFEHASQQTSWAFCSNWDAGDLEINDNDTNALYIGDLADLPPVIAHYLSLFNCTNVTGDLSDVSGVTRTLSLYNCANVTGDLSDVSGVTYFLHLINCADITGTLNPKASLKYIYLVGTGLTETQLDNSIIAVNTVTTVVGEFKWSTGVRSSASDDAYDALATAGWTLTEREW